MSDINIPPFTTSRGLAFALAAICDATPVYPSLSAGIFDAFEISHSAVWQDLHHGFFTFTVGHPTISGSVVVIFLNRDPLKILNTIVCFDFVDVIHASFG
jgi:hypothetical protein